MLTGGNGVVIDYFYGILSLVLHINAKSKLSQNKNAAMRRSH